MKLDTFEQSCKNSIQTIESMELPENNKKEILKIIEELQYEYDRSNDYYKFNMESLEEEKNILLQNFSKKDDDVKYLYDKIQVYENSYFYKLYKKFNKDAK